MCYNYPSVLQISTKKREQSEIRDLFLVSFYSRLLTAHVSILSADMEFSLIDNFCH